ncbi:hypothetical protein PHMEG_00036796 [Phytophthora megakarya]|uniref:Uncharacterized protein n=1 Tax=Phytophthora megakarya TaxID=4795 RepID=A0A225ULB3_9STRA|nr:hypothetical protein PHMEG_00036796 [Phytophthora megakarya]
MRWWLLFYVVLGCYALGVLGSFVVGWTPNAATQEELVQERQQVLQQKMVEPIKVETEPEEPEEARELEQEQEIGAQEQEIGARETTPEELIETVTAAPTPTVMDTPTTVPATEVPSTPENFDIPTRQNDMVLLAANQEEEKKEISTESDDMKVLDDVNDAVKDASKAETDAVKDPNEAEANMQAPKVNWEVEDSNKHEETPGPLATPMSEETIPPLRRSDGFYKALDLVHPPETKPPNPYFHVFPVNKNAGDDTAIVTGLRNNAPDRDSWTVEGYQHELDRLEGLKREANEETERLKRLITATDKLIVEEKDRLEDKRAASTLDIRQHQPRKIRNNMKCMGWRQTGQCNPYGKREPNSDLACNQIAQGGVSGYCEVLDEDTGELFRKLLISRISDFELKMFMRML